MQHRREQVGNVEFRRIGLPPQFRRALKAGKHLRRQCRQIVELSPFRYKGIERILLVLLQSFQHDVLAHAEVLQ